MVNGALVTVLAYGHIISAMGWLGGGILTSLVLAPNLAQLSPPSRLEFNSKVLPKIVRAVSAFIGMTFVFGFLLLYFFQDGAYGGFSVLSSGSTQGMILSVGIALALIAGIVGWGVVVPSFGKIAAISKAALAEQKPPGPEIMKYGGRAKKGSLVGLVLLVVVLAMMVTSGFYF